MKPVNVDELLITVARALEWRQLLIERRQYRAPHMGTHSPIDTKPR
jgi:DNA-binding NtrC family response regulator